MKNIILKSVIVFFTIFYIIGCNEAETIIESDPSETQVLIIEKYDAAKIKNALSVYEEEEEEKNLIYNAYFRLKIFDNYHQTFPFSLLDSSNGFSLDEFVDKVKLQRNVSIKVELKHKPTQPFPDSLRTIGIGTVKIGDLDISNYRGSNKVMGGWFVWFYSSYFGCQFTHCSECTYEFSETLNNSISGSTQFTITNSPIMQDVNVTLNLPGHCEILNIEQNQEIDTLNDLTIKLKEPIGGSGNYIDGYLVLLAHKYEITFSENGSVRGVFSRGEAGTIIMPAKRTNVITIPAEELAKFKRENKDAHKFSIYLGSHYYQGAKIPIYNTSDGSIFGTIKPNVYKNFRTFIKFKE